MRTLYGLGQSPFTEKARWALDHHRIAYRYHEHVPLLGEVLLRLKSRPKNGAKPSVPLLVDGDDVLPTSLDIARHADAIGRGDKLFPIDVDRDVVHWAEVSDRILDVGRAQVLVGLQGSPEAQREALPSFIPGALRGALAPMSVTATKFLERKYKVSRDVARESERTLRPALDEVRKALGDRPYLLDRFTFADIAIAASLRALRPEARAALGPATREVWSNEAVAKDYEDLLRWRDGVYARHRD